MVKVKVTAGELLAANGAFMKMMAADMPAITAYNVLRLIKQLGPEIEAAVEARNKVIQKHGTANQVGDYEINPKDMANALPDLQAIAKVEVELEFTPASIPGSVVLDINTLIALEKFIAVTK